MTTSEARGLLIRFAAWRAIPNRQWNTDDSSWRKVNMALVARIPLDTRPDDIATIAKGAILLGDERSAYHFARIAFHRAERMRRMQDRAWRSYRKLQAKGGK